DAYAHPAGDSNQRGGQHFSEPRHASGWRNCFSLSPRLPGRSGESMGNCRGMHPGDLDAERSRTAQPRRPQLRFAGDRKRLRADRDCWTFPARRPHLVGTLAGHRYHHHWCHPGRRNACTNYQRLAGEDAMKWILVGIIAICNTLGDVLNTAGMKRQGEVEDLRPQSLLRMAVRIFRNPLVMGGLLSLAVSFFALLSLLSIATVSFAVPATAVSYLLETLLAKYILKEDVRWRRWTAAVLVAGGVALLQW